MNEYLEKRLVGYLEDNPTAYSLFGNEYIRGFNRTAKQLYFRERTGSQKCLIDREQDYSLVLLFSFLHSYDTEVVLDVKRIYDRILKFVDKHYFFFNSHLEDRDFFFSMLDVMLIQLDSAKDADVLPVNVIRDAVVLSHLKTGLVKEILNLDREQGGFKTVTGKEIYLNSIADKGAKYATCILA